MITEAEASKDLDVSNYHWNWIRAKEYVAARVNPQSADYWPNVRKYFLEVGGEYKIDRLQIQREEKLLVVQYKQGVRLDFPGFVECINPGDNGPNAFPTHALIAINGRYEVLFPGNYIVVSLSNLPIEILGSLMGYKVIYDPSAPLSK